MKNFLNNMPKSMEEALKKEAKKKGLSGSRYGAYVYGTMNKLKAKKETKTRYA